MNTCGSSLSSSSSLITSITSTLSISSRQATTISRESGVLWDDPNQSLSRSTDGLRLSPNSSTRTCL